jgi:hypothetical protein
MDADGKSVMAYPLEVIIATNDSSFVLGGVYWLAGDLRVIRSDLVCWGDECPAQRGEVNYWPRGTWPPLGIGFPLLLQAPLIHEIWGVQRVIKPIVAADGHQIALTFDVSTWPAPQEAWKGRIVASDPLLGFAGRFVYDAESFIPSELRFTSSPAILTNYSSGEPLPPIPALRNLVSSAPAVELRGESFPGSTWTLPWTNLSADDVLAAMSNQSPTFAANLRQGCVVSFSALHPYTSLQFLGLDQTNSTMKSYQVSLYESNSPSWNNWRGDHVTFPIGTTSWSVRSPDSQDVQFPRECNKDLQLSSPTTLAKHLALASSLPWDQGSEPLLVRMEFQKSPDYLLMAHPSVEGLFFTAFGTPGSAGMQSLAQQSMPTGLWTIIAGTAAELHRLPGGFGWPY